MADMNPICGARATKAVARVRARPALARRGRAGGGWRADPRSLTLRARPGILYAKAVIYGYLRRFILSLCLSPGRIL